MEIVSTPHAHLLFIHCNRAFVKFYKGIFGGVKLAFYPIKLRIHQIRQSFALYGILHTCTISKVPSILMHACG